MSTTIHFAAAETHPAHRPLSQRPMASSGPDGDLPAEIRRAFRRAGYPALRHIEVSLDYCGVLLRGRVPSYFVKQIAQEIAMHAAGEDAVWNRIAVDTEANDAHADSYR